MLNLLIVFSASLLLACGAVHAAALRGQDVISAIPNVWILHLLTMAVAAVGAYLAGKYTPGGKEDGYLCVAPAPRWAKRLAGVLFGYAILNFLLMATWLGSGRPSVEPDGSFSLRDHGRLVRKVTEEEYHRYQAYEVRMFSGHWMVFSAIGLMLSLGAKRQKQKRDAVGLVGLEPQVACPLPEESPPPEETPREVEAGPARPPSAWAAVGSVVVIVGLVALVMTHRYAFGAAACLVSIVIGVFAVRRQLRKKKTELCETPLGCLGIVPSVILGLVMAWYLQWFVYLVLAAGPSEAIADTVRIAFSHDGPHRLTTGPVVDGRVLTVIGFVTWTFGCLLGIPGLVFLFDTPGRYLATRGREGDEKRGHHGLRPESVDVPAGGNPRGADELFG